MRRRGFEVIKAYEGSGILIPQRKTMLSAGYDIAAAAAVILQPNIVVLIPTGLKAYMHEDEYLAIHIRSGLAVKRSLSLINGQGIIDADYYNNPDNEGHIMIAAINHGTEPIIIDKGDRIAQGIFCKYLKTEDDASDIHSSRVGGLGSTGGD